MKRIVFIIFLVFILSEIRSQNNVGIGLTTPEPRSILELSAIDKGFLVPRLTTSQRRAIDTVNFASSIRALLVYDIDTRNFWYVDSVSGLPGYRWIMAIGPQGLTGPSGNIGPTGPTGPTGIAGVIGPTGFTGTVGVTGPTGSAGTAGANGATGAAGAVGATGAAGAIGSTGAAGAVGATGVAGANGTNGATGAAGAIGATGVTGVTGDQYSTTSTDCLNIQLGATCFTVATGLAYSVGQTVVIAYDISNSMVADVTSYNPLTGLMCVNVTSITGAGNYCSWAVNMNGAPGPAGPAGATGAVGATGAAGANGIDGSTGATGVTGAAGANGATGAVGANGATGAAGANGATGANGVTGATGPSTLQAAYDGGNTISTTAARPIAFTINSTNSPFTVNGTNTNLRIGFGTTSPLNYLHFYRSGTDGVWETYWENTGASDAVMQIYNTSASNGSRTLMGVTNYDASAFEAAGVYGLSINTTTTGTGGIGVVGSANNESGYGVYGSLFNDGTYSGFAGYFDADVYCGGTYYGSDKRLKRDINSITNALDIIAKLEPVSYYYDTQKYPGIGLDANRLSYGFIAQDLEEILPELVKDKNLILNSNRLKTAGVSDKMQTESFKVVNYTQMIPILVEGMKEQQTLILELKTKNSELEKRIQELEDK